MFISEFIMINIEIPYWTWIKIKCPSCWYEWLPNSKKKWMNSFEIMLYICWIFPGIIYHIRRNSSRICCCPKCGETNVKEINWDDSLVNNLIKMQRIQNYAFVAAILFFVSLVFFTRDYKLSNQNKQQGITEKVTYQQAYNNTEVNNVKDITVDTQELKEETIAEEVEEQKDPKDEIREKMQNILKEIDNKYWNIDSYVWARCYWDCINWIIKIKFRENIWWYDFTVKAHQADWSNKIIKEIPNTFEKIQIDFIYWNQIVSSCIFTEYQMNSYAPKWCTYYWYKE